MLGSSPPPPPASMSPPTAPVEVPNPPPPAKLESLEVVEGWLPTPSFVALHATPARAITDELRRHHGDMRSEPGARIDPERFSALRAVVVGPGAQDSFGERRRRPKPCAASGDLPPPALDR